MADNERRRANEEQAAARRRARDLAAARVKTGTFPKIPVLVWLSTQQIVCVDFNRKTISSWTLGV